MLTAELVRTRRSKDKIRPSYINPDDEDLLGLAGILIESFKENVGKRRESLDASLKEITSQDTKLLLERGLIKILEDRCTFESNTSKDPVEIREYIFKRAGELRKQGKFDRDIIINETVQETGISMEELEKTLYGDLKDNHYLTQFKDISPQKLLQRYNVALVQGILLKATKIDIWINGQTVLRYRQLFRAIKFFRLLHQIEGSMKNGYKITLDGPMSLFSSCQKYGFQMAQFFPALLLCNNWELKASIRWGKKSSSCLLDLSSEEGLTSHYPDDGMWFPPEWNTFVQRFHNLGSPWDVSVDTDILAFEGGVVIVPDYVFNNKETGDRVYLEIFGYWRKGSVEKRLDLLQSNGLTNIILALSKKLHVGEEVQQVFPDHVYVFNEILIPRDVLSFLSRF